MIEQRETTSWHPKTRNFNTRTMEIARGWGLATYARLRSIDTPPGWKNPIRFLQTAVGEQYGLIDSMGCEGPGPEVSPALPVMSSQELIEEIMLDAARASGLVEVRFSTEAIRLIKGGNADDTKVVLELRDRVTRKTATITGPALVAADGASSTIRSELGLELLGRQEMAHLVNCYFRADIERYIGDRTGVLFFVNNDAASGVLQPLDAAGRLSGGLGAPLGQRRRRVRAGDRPWRAAGGRPTPKRPSLRSPVRSTSASSSWVVRSLPSGSSA